MINLLSETTEFLNSINRKPEDVLFVGTLKNRMSWNTFSKNADFDYDNGFGGQEIAPDLAVYGKDFVCYRHEYDGSENWEVIFLPEAFSITKNINYNLDENSKINLKTYDPDNYISWESLDQYLEYPEGVPLCKRY